MTANRGPNPPLATSRFRCRRMVGAGKPVAASASRTASCVAGWGARDRPGSPGRPQSSQLVVSHPGRLTSGCDTSGWSVSSAVGRHSMLGMPRPTDARRRSTWASLSFAPATLSRSASTSPASLRGGLRRCGLRGLRGSRGSGRVGRGRASAPNIAGTLDRTDLGVTSRDYPSGGPLSLVAEDPALPRRSAFRHR